MSQILFTEEQRFRQWWFQLLMVFVVLGSYLPLFFVAENDEFYNGLLIVSVCVLPIMWLVYAMRLETIIDDREIRVRFFPFHLQPISLPLSDIEQAYVRAYKPLKEFGGWGIRYGRKGKAYNVQGNMGLQLMMTSGKQLLIGTQRPEELDQIISRILGSTDSASTNSQP